MVHLKIEGSRLIPEELSREPLANCLDNRASRTKGSLAVLERSPSAE